jgi:hypothetical protein
MVRRSYVSSEVAARVSRVRGSDPPRPTLTTDDPLSSLDRSSVLASPSRCA